MAEENSGSADGSANAGSANANTGGSANINAGASFDYDVWLGKQPDDVKAGLEAHNLPLVNAFTRQKETTKELRATLDKIKKSGSSESEKSQQMQTALDEATKKTSFFQNCPRDIANPKAAHAIASANGCIREDGSLDLEKFKTDFPEQFVQGGTGGARGHAGTGTGGNPAGNPPKQDMNDAIREMAGR